MDTDMFGCKELLSIGKEFCKSAKEATDVDDLDMDYMLFKHRLKQINIAKNPPVEDLESQLMIQINLMLLRLISNAYMEHYQRLKETNKHLTMKVRIKNERDFRAGVFGGDCFVEYWPNLLTEGMEVEKHENGFWYIVGGNDSSFFTEEDLEYLEIVL